MGGAWLCSVVFTHELFEVLLPTSDVIKGDIFTVETRLLSHANVIANVTYL